MIGQTLHGYAQGHRLLAVGGDVDKNELEILERLSDLSGYLPFGLTFPQYYNAFPCGRYYAFSCTWPDPEAPRGGAVHTQTLLLPFEFLDSLVALEQVFPLFSRPQRGQYDAYRVALPLPVLWAPPPENPVPPRLIAAFFGGIERPLYWVSPGPSPLLDLWRLIGKKARSRLSFCTFTLQPRTLTTGPFDVLGVPIEARGAFHQERRRAGWLEEAGSVPVWAEQLAVPGALRNLLERAEKDGIPEPVLAEIPTLFRFYELEEAARLRLPAARTRADLLAKLQTGTAGWEQVLLDLIHLQDQAPMEPRPFWDLADLLQRPQVGRMAAQLRGPLGEMLLDQIGVRLQVHPEDVLLGTVWEAAQRVELGTAVEQAVENLVHTPSLNRDQMLRVVQALYQQPEPLLRRALAVLPPKERREAVLPHVAEERVAELAKGLGDAALLLLVRQAQEKPGLVEALVIAKPAQREDLLTVVSVSELLDWWLEVGENWALRQVVSRVGVGMADLAERCERGRFGPKLLDAVTISWPVQDLKKLFWAHPVLCLRMLREGESERNRQVALECCSEEQLLEAVELLDDKKVVERLLPALVRILLEGPTHVRLPIWCASSEVQHQISRLYPFQVSGWVQKVPANSLQFLLEQAGEHSARMPFLLQLSLRSCDRATLEEMTPTLLALQLLPLGVKGEVLGAVRRLGPPNGYRLVEACFRAVYEGCGRTDAGELRQMSWWQEMWWDRAKSWRHWLVDVWVDKRWPAASLKKIISFDADLSYRVRKRLGGSREGKWLEDELRPDHL